MENLLDLADPVETQSVSAIESIESDAAESKAPTVPEHIEEIDTAPATVIAKGSADKTAKPARYQHEEPPPNPLLLDPYEWDKCTITVGYSLLPNQKVSVSVHNHKDEPIVQEFPAEEAPLPEKIMGVMASLQRIWPTSRVNTTVVLLPKAENATERSIVAAVRVAADTPIVQEGVESNLPFPAPILAMLEQLKALMPERALKNIEKNAKAKAPTTTKTTAKPASASKPAAAVSVPAATKSIRQNQMTLF
jgi:hypothetical protein